MQHGREAVPAHFAPIATDDLSAEVGHLGSAIRTAPGIDAQAFLRCEPGFGARRCGVQVVEAKAISEEPRVEAPAAEQTQKEESRS